MRRDCRDWGLRVLAMRSFRSTISAEQVFLVDQSATYGAFFEKVAHRCVILLQRQNRLVRRGGNQQDDDDNQRYDTHAGANCGPNPLP